MNAPLVNGRDPRQAIRIRIVELANRRHIDASSLKDSDGIPQAGVLDSAGMLELVIWFEQTFGVEVDQSDLTIENFGTIDAMANYLSRAS